MRVALVMPPLASVNIPSLGLTQLKSRLRELRDLEVTVHYWNHDLAALVGVDLYEAASLWGGIYHTGFGEWLFRQAAFPELPDNREEYFARYFRRQTREREIVTQVAAHREGFAARFDDWIVRDRLHTADVVGFTSMFMQTAASIAIARRIKAVNPNVVTALGGPACEAPMGREIAAQVSCIDYVFSGPGLVNFPVFLERLGAGDREALGRLRGVFSGPGRGAPRLPVDGCASELGEELDINQRIELDYSDFLTSFEAKIGPAGHPMLMFETSRGCWWGEIRHCKFCGLNGGTMHHREMSAAQALEQFRSLFGRYPQIKRFAAVDNILPLSYLENVLPHLEPPPGVTLFYEVKSNMTDEQVELLARSGLRFIQPGIESLNTAVLKLMQKGVTAFQNIQLLKSCAIHDVSPEWYILLGFPGEPETGYAKYLRDLPSLWHLPPPFAAVPLRFDRYSPYATNPKEHGLTIRPFDFYRLIYPFDDASMNRFAYHFQSSDPQYYVPLARWRSQIVPLVDQWITRYHANDGAERAQLYFSGATIIDSRSGRTLELRLPEAARRVLLALERPRGTDTLRSELPDIDVAGELERLQQFGLLFEEEGRFLSLVLHTGARKSVPVTSHWTVPRPADAPGLDRAAVTR